MNWLVFGPLVAVAGVVAIWIVQAFRRRNAADPIKPLFLVKATRQPGGWIKIVVTVSNQAPEELYLQTIELVYPTLGELVMQTDESELVSGREIAINGHLPPSAGGIELPSTTLELALDDPVGLVDEIGLTAAVSRRPDREVGIVLSSRTHVWMLPNG